LWGGVKGRRSADEVGGGGGGCERGDLVMFGGGVWGGHGRTD